MNTSFVDYMIAEAEASEFRYKAIEATTNPAPMTAEEVAIMNHALAHPKDGSYRPYCLGKNCTVMPRMVLVSGGFRCWSCGNEIGFDLNKKQKS